MNHPHRKGHTVPRHLTLALAIVGLAAAVVGLDAGNAAGAPPDDTAEIEVTSGDVVAPGGHIEVGGTCWSGFLGATEVATVRGYRVAGQTPDVVFDFRRDLLVDDATGAFSGRLEVPDSTPAGSYRVSVQCRTQDQVVAPEGGDVQDDFRVEGDPLVTTSTTSTSTSTSTTSPPVNPSSPAVPATPLAGTANYTG